MKRNAFLSLRVRFRPFNFHFSLDPGEIQVPKSSEHRLPSLQHHLNSKPTLSRSHKSSRPRAPICSSKSCAFGVKTKQNKTGKNCIGSSGITFQNIRKHYCPGSCWPKFHHPLTLGQTWTSVVQWSQQPDVASILVTL